MQGTGGAQPWLVVGRELHGAQGQMFENWVHQQGSSSICGTGLGEEESLFSQGPVQLACSPALNPLPLGPITPSSLAIESQVHRGLYRG